MPFSFEAEKYKGRAREKYLEAEKRITKIHNRYPEVKQAYSYLQSLKREYSMAKVGIFNKNKMKKHEIEELENAIKELEKQYHAILKKNDIPLDYKEPDWDCEKCHDTGRIYDGQKYVVCSCVENELRKKKQLIGNLPTHLHSATFNNSNLNYYDHDIMKNSDLSYFENAKNIYKMAATFVENFEADEFNRGLIIEGPIGSGKSYLLGCMANALIDRGIRFRYIVYSDLLQQIRSTYNEDNPTTDEKKIINDVQNIPVLLIDDLGTEKASDFAASILYQIIDKRYREERPIILSTNYSLKNLKNRFPIMGERIFQRLLEMNEYVELAGNVRLKIIDKQQEA
ncbi:MAG: ATP-binding protein [Bacillota bacterium]